MADRINLAVDQGADFSYVKTIYDANEEPLANITSYTFLSQLRKTPLSSIAADLTVTPSDPGRVTLSIGPTVSNSIDPGRYCYDVLMVASDQTVTRLFEGIITLNPCVTRQANT